MPGYVEAVWRAAAEGEPMTAVETAYAMPGGLDDDRYQCGNGYYSPFDVCEVTFIAAEALDSIHDRAGIDLSGGEHRRNVVTRGVDLGELLASRFRIGQVVFEGTRPRPPCRHVEEVAEIKGLMDALRERGGICADVVAAGEFVVGDEIEILGSTAVDSDGLAAAIAERADEQQDW